MSQAWQEGDHTSILTCHINLIQIRVALKLKDMYEDEGVFLSSEAFGSLCLRLSIWLCKVNQLNWQDEGRQGVLFSLK